MKYLFWLIAHLLLISNINQPKTYKGSTCGDSLKDHIEVTERNKEESCGCVVLSQRVIQGYITNISSSQQQVNKIELRTTAGEIYFKESYSCDNLYIDENQKYKFQFFLKKELGDLESANFNLILEIFSTQMKTNEVFSEEITLNYSFCD